VAVLPVLLFHLNERLVPGGFVGVDIFFVISGYLIGSILLRELVEGRYSITRFYERRIRRIFPALFVVMFSAGVAAFFLLLPSDLAAFCDSVIAATFFFSNLFFWGEAGYFDAPAELKPLLHTWSLAVEEQFYIVFPVLLALIHRLLGRRAIVPLLVVAFVASFALSAWGVEKAPVATFYLLPTRAWELLCGALLAAGALPVARVRWLREAAAVVGVALIALSMALLDRSSAFPGPNALAPCLGAALLIHAGANGGATTLGRLLGSAPLRFIGLISYSLYLWHWPLIVLVKYVWIEELPVAMQCAVALASLALAVLTWRYVETPFRDRSRTSAGVVFRMAFATLTLAPAVALIGVLTAGLPARMPQSVVRLADVDSYRDPTSAQCHMTYSRRATLSQMCRRGAPDRAATFVLVGDSHAGAAAGGVFAGASAAGVAGLQLSDSGYRPLLGLKNVDEPDKYEWMNRRLVEVLRDPAIRIVVLVVYWDQALQYRYRSMDGVALDSVDAVRSSLRKTVRAYADREFVLLSSPPTSAKFGANPAARAQLFHRTIEVAVPRSSYEDSRRTYMEILNDLAREPNVRVIDVAEVLCDSVVCSGMLDGEPAYRDSNHLTNKAALLLAPLIAAALQPRPAGTPAGATVTSR
jgi:peptidoglycan/LPS O-acetylase OafA/YrhL